MILYYFLQFFFTFTQCVVLVDWSRAIICPIPKDMSKCMYDPSNYRGISVLPCIAKLYSIILNNRIVKYYDVLDIIVDEQYGFRTDLSCLHHIYTLTSIVRHRNNQKLSTCCAFIHFEKAFYCINRELLFYKLLSYNINGNIYKSIYGLYVNLQSCIKNNDIFTFLC